MIIASIDVCLFEPAGYQTTPNGRLVELRFFRTCDEYGSPAEDQFGKHWRIVQGLPAHVRKEDEAAGRQRPILGNGKNVRAPHEALQIVALINLDKVKKDLIEKYTRRNEKDAHFLHLCVVPLNEKEKAKFPETDYWVSQGASREKRLEGVESPRIGIAEKHEGPPRRSAAPPPTPPRPQTTDEQPELPDGEGPPPVDLGDDDIPF